MTSHRLLTLAVMCRTNDRNLGHVSVLDDMNEAGLGYLYGLYRGTPDCYHRRKRERLYAVAETLEQMAKERP